MASRVRKMRADDWAKTTWEGNRRVKIKRWAELTLDEILAAQEEMADLAKEIADAKIRPNKTNSVFEKPSVYKVKTTKCGKKRKN